MGPPPIRPASLRLPKGGCIPLSAPCVVEGKGITEMAFGANNCPRLEPLLLPGSHFV